MLPNYVGYKKKNQRDARNCFSLCMFCLQPKYSSKINSTNHIEIVKVTDCNVPIQNIGRMCDIATS